MVQATPLRPVAFERRVILDAGYENSAFLLKNSIFGKHLKSVTELAPICGANCIKGTTEQQLDKLMLFFRCNPFTYISHACIYTFNREVQVSAPW